MSHWSVGSHTLNQHLILGTAQYPSPHVLQLAIKAAQVEIVTVSIRRQTQHTTGEHHPFFDMIRKTCCHILPNTAGCYTVQEAVSTARVARELLKTSWIKLEVIESDYHLNPNPFALVEAAKILVQDGFQVFPYCTEDLTLCQKLVDIGCVALMPWGSPIGSGQGLLNPYALHALRQRFPDIPIILDAGIGKPSHACQAMELGLDAVLLNTAVALSPHPIQMAQAFAHAVQAGHLGYEAGMMPKRRFAHPSTPVVGQPFWHQQKDANSS